jgi:hypothetical protein
MYLYIDVEPVLEYRKTYARGNDFSGPPLLEALPSASLTTYVPQFVTAFTHFCMYPKKQLYKTAITKFAVVSPSDSIDLGLVLLGNLNMDTALQNSHHKIRDSFPPKTKKRKIVSLGCLKQDRTQWKIRQGHRGSWRDTSPTSAYSREYALAPALYFARVLLTPTATHFSP